MRKCFKTQQYEVNIFCFIYSAIFFLFFVCMSFLSAQEKGSIRGKVIDDDGKAIPYVKILIKHNNESWKKKEIPGIFSDMNGNYAFEALDNDEYYLRVIPNRPYCNDSFLVDMQKGGIKEIKIVLRYGGELAGRVFKNDLKTPIEGAIINVTTHEGARNFYYDEAISKSDGSFSLWLSPNTDKNNKRTDTYFLFADCRIQGIATKTEHDIDIYANKTTVLHDLVFNLNSDTGIEGYVYSSIEGIPLQNIQIEIRKSLFQSFGLIKTDKYGHFVMKDMIPDTYSLIIVYDVYRKDCRETKKIRKEINIEKGKINSLIFQLDVFDFPSTLFSMKEFITKGSIMGSGLLIDIS